LSRATSSAWGKRRKRPVSVRSCRRLDFVAGNKIVEIGPHHRPFLQCKTLVGAQIVDPQFLRVRLRRDPLLVEEQDVRLHTLLIENAGRQSHECVKIEIVQQAAADRLAGAALEQHIVGHHDGGSAVLGEHGHDVLQEIELLVRSRHEEILAVVALALRVDLAVVTDDPVALLLAEGRIGQDHVVRLPAVTQQRVARLDRALTACDVVQIEVHRA
jgi:hypothetical protein